MPCKKDKSCIDTPKCSCEDRIKTIKENLVVLCNLFVREDVFIRGDLFVRGRIFNESGGFPNLGPGLPGGADPCSVGTTISEPGRALFVTSENHCTTVVQGPLTTSPSNVFYGLFTPDGTYIVINQSTSIVVNVDPLNGSQARIIVPVATIGPVETLPTIAVFNVASGIVTQLS